MNDAVLPLRLNLRPTLLPDLAFVHSVETDPRKLPFIAPCVRWLKAMASQDLRARRFWPDVKALNSRAQALCASEGFVEEGRLRARVRVMVDGVDGYDASTVMSMLDRECQARVALGQEASA